MLRHWKASAENFDDDEVSRMVDIKHERVSHSDACPKGACNCDRILGFVLELPTIDAVEMVVEEFTDSLSASVDVLHALKFEDPLLQRDLAYWAAEIFTLEMKLRRVLSIIYLHAFKHRDPYNLLKNDKVSPMMSNLRLEDMADLTENEFFHLNFRQYTSLNDHSTLSLPDVLAIIRDSDSYAQLRDELTRSPVNRGEDVELLSDLKALMDPIERMRNCVAHNRTPSANVRQSYSATRSEVEKRLDRYLQELGGG